MPHPPVVAGAPAPMPAATSLLCEPCMASCGGLSLQGPNTYLTGQNFSPQVSSCAFIALYRSKCPRSLLYSQDLGDAGLCRQPVAATRLQSLRVGCHALLQALQLQDGVPLACASGYCIPQQRPDLLQVCAAGTGRELPGHTAQSGQPAAAPAAKAGRRLLAWVRSCLIVSPYLPFLCAARDSLDDMFKYNGCLRHAPITALEQHFEVKACLLQRLS